MKKKAAGSRILRRAVHNIGTLILIQKRFQDYSKAADEASPKSCNMLGPGAGSLPRHASGGRRVSGKLVEAPFPIVEAALYHHNPLDPAVINKEIVAAVHLAQHYAWTLTKQPAVTEFYPETSACLNPRRYVRGRSQLEQWI
jgi:hypothetical protein